MAGSLEKQEKEKVDAKSSDEKPQEGLGTEKSDTVPSKKARNKHRTNFLELTPPQKGVSGWVDGNSKFLTFAQVALVLCTAIVYLFGYICWSYNAWETNLGLLPASQVQYFTAGAPFLLILTFCTGVVKVGQIASHLANTSCRAKDSTDIDVEKLDKRMRFFGVTIPVVVILYLLYKLVWYTRLSVGAVLLFEIIWGVFMFLYIGVAIGLFRATGITEKAQGTMKIVYFALGNHFYVNIIIMFLTCSALYIIFYYKDIPQEFGGLRPRFAYLDLKRADLSPELRSAILPKSAKKLPAVISSDTMPIARSVMLDVYYVNNDVLVVRPHGADNNKPAIQIKGSSVQGITWYAPKRDLSKYGFFKFLL